MTAAPSTPAAARPPAAARGGSLRFAAGLFAAGVLIAGVVLLLTGGSSQTPAKPPPVKLPKLSEAFNDRLLGVTGLSTRNWVIGGLGPFLHLESTDHTAIIAIGAPGAARTAHGALHVAIATVRHSYKNVTLKQARGSSLGGRPAYSVVMYGTNARGVHLRILIATAVGRKLAYVMQVFTATKAPLTVLEEAQEIIATLRFNN
ncbi:MAG: hypothetical protein ACR2KV_06170 [Solirubrobacteraceae bacterium]